jgi:hypothetical protein
MDHLDSLESESIHIPREAFNKIERPGMARAVAPALKAWPMSAPC